MPFGDYKELLDLVECLKKDFEKFYLKGIKVSGTRIRAGLQDIKKKIQDIRLFGGNLCFDRQKMSLRKFK